MIIQLKNFGPIEHFEFDTDKDMHFIFGENNIGKSYAISAVYLILKNWKSKYDFYPIKDYSYSPINEYNELAKKIKSENQKIEITREFKALVEHFLHYTFLLNIEKSLMNSFSSISGLNNKYSNKSFSITIKLPHVSITIKQFEGNLRLDEISLNSIYLQRHQSGLCDITFPDRGISGFYIGSNFEVENLDNYFVSSIRDFLEMDGSFSNIFFLPAFRSAIYNSLSSFSGIIVQLTQLRTQIPNLKFEIPNLTEPNSDYFMNLSNINTKGYKTQFSKFATLIEDNIIKGKVNFDKSDRKLYYEPYNLNLSLELSLSSSMISEIAPIAAHLKFIIAEDKEAFKKEDYYLFIEEPEAHLHPKIQVELIKLFAEMAKKGLKIVMTSHSNYMFNKLSNMILAKEIDFNTISVAHMKMGEKGSYVDKESMLVDEFGIEDNNFADVAEELYMERLKLSEQNY